MHFFLNLITWVTLGYVLGYFYLYFCSILLTFRRFSEMSLVCVAMEPLLIYESFMLILYGERLKILLLEKVELPAVFLIRFDFVKLY